MHAASVKKATQLIEYTQVAGVKIHILA